MRKIPLTRQVMQVLKPALYGAKATIKREIATGKSSLFQSSNGLLFVVLRPEGEQLVVVAAAGSKLRDSRHEIITFARSNNFESIRFHTRHPKHLAKGLTGLPIRLIEVRKGLLSNEFIYQLNLSEV